MTAEYKAALLEMLRVTPDAEFTNVNAQYKIPFMMLEWLEQRFPEHDLRTPPPGACSTINWPLYMQLSGLKTLDFYLNPPPREEQLETGIMRKFPYNQQNRAYPCPSIGPILYYNHPNYGELADIIEYFYIDAGGFDEVRDMIASQKQIA